MKKILTFCLFTLSCNHLVAQGCCNEMEHFKNKTALYMFCQITNEIKGVDWKKTYNKICKKERRETENWNDYPLCMSVAKILVDTTMGEKECQNLINFVEKKFQEYTFLANKNMRLNEEGNYVFNRRTCIDDFIKKIKSDFEKNTKVDTTDVTKPPVKKDQPPTEPAQKKHQEDNPKNEEKLVVDLAPIEPIDEGNFLLESIYFKNNSYEIDLTYKQNKIVLGKVIDILKQCKGCKIKVYGYADDPGKSTSNEKLSENRAKSLMQYVKEQGVDIGNFDMMGFGEMGSGKDNARKVELQIYGVKQIKP